MQVGSRCLQQLQQAMESTTDTRDAICKRHVTIAHDNPEIISLHQDAIDFTPSIIKYDNTEKEIYSPGSCFAKAFLSTAGRRSMVKDPGYQSLCH